MPNSVIAALEKLRRLNPDVMRTHVGELTARRLDECHRLRLPDAPYDLHLGQLRESMRRGLEDDQVTVWKRWVHALCGIREENRRRLRTLFFALRHAPDDFPGLVEAFIREEWGATRLPDRENEEQWIVDITDYRDPLLYPWTNSGSGLDSSPQRLA